MLRRAAPTALRDPQAGAPGLLNVPYSTFAGADPQAGTPARGAAHSDRSFRRFATTWCEKSGLNPCYCNYLIENSVNLPLSNLRRLREGAG